jgi:hypothetical protein
MYAVFYSGYCQIGDSDLLCALLFKCLVLALTNENLVSSDVSNSSFAKLRLDRLVSSWERPMDVPCNP